MSGTNGSKPAGQLSEHELDVLVAAFLPWKGCHWLPVMDQFMTPEGYRTRAGRAMRNSGYIRQRPGIIAWLPQVAGAGRRKRDEPTRLMEITSAGVYALRQRMGDASFKQLQVLARERQGADR